MPDDIRQTGAQPGADTGAGDGAANSTGYGAGGLGQGGDRAQGAGSKGEPTSWDAPGVTPDGRRTGSSVEGPRTAHDGEGEENPDSWAQGEEPNDG